MGPTEPLSTRLAMAAGETLGVTAAVSGVTGFLAAGFAGVGFTAAAWAVGTHVAAVVAPPAAVVIGVVSLLRALIPAPTEAQLQYEHGRALLRLEEDRRQRESEASRWAGLTPSQRAEERAQERAQERERNAERRHSELMWKLDRRL